MLGHPKPSLGFFDAVSLMVGIVIGVGIFETTPVIAGELPSPTWVFAVWILGGLLSLAGALCYAELATANPENGGDYIYLSRAFGRATGFLFAWGRLVVVQPGFIAAIAFPFAHFSIKTAEILFGWVIGESAVVPLAVAGVLALTLLNCLGLRIGTRTQNALTTLKVLGLVAIAVTALFAPAGSDRGTAAELSWHGLGIALILVMFTFGGWSDIAYVAAEVRDNRRAIPRAIGLTVVGVAVLYLFSNYAFLRALGHGGVAVSKAVAVDATMPVLPSLAQALVGAAIALSALGTINASLFTGARIGQVLGRDFPGFRPLAYWSATHGGPVVALLCLGLGSAAIIVMIGSFERTVVYTTPVVWLFSFLSTLSLVVLRFKNGRAGGPARPFSVPAYPLLPLVFAAACLYILHAAIDYDLAGSLVSLGILILGVPVYRLTLPRSPDGPGR